MAPAPWRTNGSDAAKSGGIAAGGVGDVLAQQLVAARLAEIAGAQLRRIASPTRAPHGHAFEAPLHRFRDDQRLVRHEIHRIYDAVQFPREQTLRRGRREKFRHRRDATRGVN
jgi:hypothetical protein